MSRDGYLPPGCTEKDVDMSAPDYWDAVEHQEQQRHEFEKQEARNFMRRNFVRNGADLMENDRMWFKWQLAVWAEQTGMRIVG